MARVLQRLRLHVGPRRIVGGPASRFLRRAVSAQVAINGRKVSTMDQLFWAGISTWPGCPERRPRWVDPKRPAGRRADIGSGYSDLACIAFAGWIEKEYYAFVPPPG